MSTTTRILWVLPILLFSAGLALQATETKDDDDEAMQSDFVEYVDVNVSELPTSNTIATKLPTPLQLTPANVGSVSSALIREQDADVLGDALYNVSSLNIQAGPAVFDFFSIRGFDSTNGSLILTDGAAEPEAMFFQMYNVEGVEVLKGPGGFLYGANPLAGTVNMVRKQPLDTNFGVFSGSAGSFSTYEAAFDWNRASKDGSTKFRLNALWNESDGYRDSTESANVAINPSFSWDLSDRTTLNFNFEYVNSEYQPDSGLPLWAPNPTAPTNLEIPPVPRTQTYQSPLDFSEQDIYRFQFNTEIRLSERLTLRNKAYYRGLDWQTDGTLLNGVFDRGAGSEVLRTWTRLDDDQQILGNQFEALLELSSGPVEHSILAGLELARHTDEFTIGYLPPEPFFAVFGMPTISLFDPVETFTTEPAVTLPLDSGDATTDVIAPYVIDQMAFSEKWQLLVGLRYDDIDFEDTVDGDARSSGKTSPMLGGVWAPNPSLSLYANAGQAYAPASARVSGTPEPEKSSQVEVGVKKQFLSGRLQTTFAAYEIERENIAIPDANGVTQQAGDQRSRGFEIEIAAEPRPRLRTFFSYAYVDAELTRFARCGPPCIPGFTAVEELSGNKPAYAPEHLASVWVSRSFKSGLGVAGGLRYFADQFLDPDNAYEVQGAVVFDAAVFYDLEAWRFKLNFKNLLDEEYESGSFASLSVVPANEFAVFGSFDYRF